MALGCFKAVPLGTNRSKNTNLAGNIGKDIKVSWRRARRSGCHTFLVRPPSSNCPSRDRQNFLHSIGGVMHVGLR